MGEKITIKDKSGNIIFEYSTDNNSLKKTIEEAIKKDVNLSYANLSYANLSRVDLRGADLSNADLRGTDLGYANLRYINLGWADLRRANLGCADLRGADLRGANLSYANLGYVDLNGANLSGANLSYANLGYANLRGADLGWADLRGSDLSNADLRDANLIRVNLDWADLSRANLRGAENKPYIPTNLPEGDFVAWKKVKGKIIKLRVLEDSLRSRATTDKCRCDKALVLEIQDLDGNKLDIKEVINKSYAECKYVVGETVYADKWDEDRWNECSHGINFFLDRQTAVNY